MKEQIEALCREIIATENNERIYDEQFIAYDWFGGNMDDAYQGGMEDGELLGKQSLATQILNLLKTNN